MNADDKASVLLSLKNIEQQYHQLDNQIKKLEKLHERLAIKDQMLSMSGAVKLYKAYESTLETAEAQLLHMENAKIKVDLWLDYNNQGDEQRENIIFEDPEFEVISSTGSVENDTEESFKGPLQELPKQPFKQPFKSFTSPITEGMNEKSPDQLNYKDISESHSPIIDVELESSGEATPMENYYEKEDESFPFIFEPGTSVAVLCKVDKESFHEDWILATIVQYFPEKSAYEVEDLEFDDEMNTSPSKNNQGEGSVRFMVPSDKIRKLPSTAEQENQQMKIKQLVLALFPGTTCLYPATVVSTPARRKKTRDYLVKFVDDDAPHRSVPPRFILPKLD